MSKHASLGRKRQRGVNLIEIMVAMVIGLFLVAGATTLYVSTKKTADVDDAIARLQETARYALSTIETDVRMANYYGASKDSPGFHGTPKENLMAKKLPGAIEGGSGQADCGDVYTTNAYFYIEATNNKYTLTCGAKTAEVDSADTLTVRRVERAATALNPQYQQVVSTLTCGEIVVGKTKECPLDGEIHNLIVNGYYVDKQSDQSANIPSLRRHLLTTKAGAPAFIDQEVIAGVEDMQIELGWDSNGDAKTRANAVSYLQPDNALLTTVDPVSGATLPNGRVVAVRVWLLIRADIPDPTFKDTRIYEYGDRSKNTGTVTDINAASAAGKAYAPGDNYRRLLVSRTLFVRNISGT